MDITRLIIQITIIMIVIIYQLVRASSWPPVNELGTFSAPLLMMGSIGLR